MTRRARILISLFAALTVIAVADVASAQQIQCQIHSIRATSTGGEISQSLNAFRNLLLRPPLSAFTSFDLIHTRSVSLSLGSSQPLQLEQGITGEIRFNSSLGAQRELNLSLRHQGRNLLNTTFRVTPGHPMFVVAGSVIPQGTLVLGIVCR